MLDRLLDFAGKTSRVLAWLGGGMLIFAAILTTIDVFLRKFLDYSFGGADEISGYMFAISTAFAFSFAMLQRTHVRIDALYIHLPRAARLFLDVLGFLALGGFITLICVRAYVVWKGSWDNDSVSITPLVTPLDIPQGFWLVGLVFAVLCFVVILLRVGQAIVQRDWMTVSRVIGARSLEEEIAEEAEQAHAEIEREHARTQTRHT